MEGTHQWAFLEYSMQWEECAIASFYSFSISGTFFNFNQETWGEPLLHITTCLLGTVFAVHLGWQHAPTYEWVVRLQQYIKFLGSPRGKFCHINSFSCITCCNTTLECFHHKHGICLEILSTPCFQLKKFQIPDYFPICQEIQMELKTTKKKSLIKYCFYIFF